jgi:hypothetical protein
MGSQLNDTGKKYSVLSEVELEENARLWRRCHVDFQTMGITATIDPNTFTKNSMMIPIVTSTNFINLCLETPYNPNDKSVSYTQLYIQLILYTT